MKEQPHSPPRFAVCINNTEYPASLERHKIYRVLPDEEAAKDGDVRVIDESGEDYLYPGRAFCTHRGAKGGGTGVAANLLIQRRPRPTSGWSGRGGPRRSPAPFAGRSAPGERGGG